MGSSHGSDAAIADGLLPYAQQRNSTRNRMSARKCRTSKVVWRWRLPEFFVWGVVLSTVMYLLEHTQEYEQEVPAGNRDGINSYPVRLGSEWCTSTELSACAETDSSCCAEMDNGVYPGETVPTAVLWLIYFAFPLVFIIAREGLRRYGKYRAVGTLPDALLGLTFSLGLCVVVTVAIKKAVGRPRPNWAALRALVTYGGSAYSDLAVSGAQFYVLVFAGFVLCHLSE